MDASSLDGATPTTASAGAAHKALVLHAAGGPVLSADDDATDRAAVAPGADAIVAARFGVGPRVVQAGAARAPGQVQVPPSCPSQTVGASRRPAPLLPTRLGTGTALDRERGRASRCLAISSRIGI